jgi:hypothetical protein
LKDLCEDTVLIKQQDSAPERLAEDWKVDNDPLHHSPRRAEQLTDTHPSETKQEVKLFEGKHVEDFEVTDFAQRPEDVTLPSPTTPQKANTWHASPHSAQKATVDVSQGNVEGHHIHALASELGQDTASQPLRRRSIGHLPTQVSHALPPAAVPVQQEVSSKIDLKSTSMMLSTMGEPDMTMDYMQMFKICMNSLLAAWQDIFTEEPENPMEELEQIQESLQVAEKLDKVLMLEEGNLKLAARPEYRMSLLKILRLRSVEQELIGLSETVRTVIRLLRHHSSEDARRIFADVKFKGLDGAERRLDDLKNMARRSFLAWPWILSDAADFTKEPEEAARSLARNFSMILDNSDEHIKRRKDQSTYLKAERKSLPELEQCLSTVQMSCQIPARETSLEGPSNIPDTSQARTRFSHVPTEADRCETTASSIMALVQTTKDLIDLFVPCGSSHPMLEKVWGSLVSSSQVSMQCNCRAPCSK